jgi:hypothetical protein
MSIIPSHPRIVLVPAEVEPQVAEEAVAEGRAEVGRHPADLAGAAVVGDHLVGAVAMGRIVEVAAQDRVRRALATESLKLM